MTGGPAFSRPSGAEPAEGPQFREKKLDVPPGLWLRCHGCEQMQYKKAVASNLEVCPRCNYHFRIGARTRVEQIADPASFEDLFADISPTDPLKFEWAGKAYADRIRIEQERTGAVEAVQTGVAYIKGRRVALGVMDGEWLMGSLGSVVGEKLTSLIEHAMQEKLPLVIVCTSGGARMHEGALSLMQMAKTSAALARLDQAGGLYIAVLTNPTTGGTTASFAMLGDVILAEPDALIGFAGQRVIANTVKTELPEGFQRAEFLVEHGYIDRVVPRSELRNEIARIIDYWGM